MAHEHEYVRNLERAGSDARTPALPRPGGGRTITLRSPKEKDAESLHTVYLDAFSTRTRALLDAATWTRKWPRDPDCVLELSTLAWAGDVAVGYLLAYLDQDLRGEGIIGQLGVRRAHRERGVGRAMLTRTLRCFSAHGLEIVTLSVAPDNVDAIRLYERLGFARRG